MHRTYAKSAMSPWKRRFCQNLCFYGPPKSYFIDMNYRSMRGKKLREFCWPVTIITSVVVVTLMRLLASRACTSKTICPVALVISWSSVTAKSRVPVCPGCTLPKLYSQMPPPVVLLQIQPGLLLTLSKVVKSGIVRRNTKLLSVTWLAFT